MKVLYVARVDNKLTGVIKKINDTVITWNQMGIDTKVYNSYQRPNKPKNIISELFFIFSKYFSFLFDFYLHVQIKTFKPDIVYWRFGPIPLLQCLPCSTKLIVESNTNLRVEKKSRSLLRRFALVKYKNIFNKLANGVVGVTPECLEDFDKIKTSLILGNGIKFDTITFKDSIKFKNVDNMPVGLFLGSPGCEWHGLDKLMGIAKLHPIITFVVVGYEINETLFNPEQIPSNVVFKGYLSGDELLDELKNATFGIGSLAMERAGMVYSSSLKNRTYLQYALPIIIQGEDLDLIDLKNVISLPVKFSDYDAKMAINRVLNASFSFNDAILLAEKIGTDSLERKRLLFFQSLD